MTHARRDHLDQELIFSRFAREQVFPFPVVL